MARTKNPHLAAIRSWETRRKHTGPSQQGGDWRAQPKADPRWKDPKPTYDYSKGMGPDDDEYWAFRKEEKAWEQAMSEAVALGEVSPEEAKKRGWKREDPEKVVELPLKLYHVTTDADAVMRSGLKSRAELEQDFGIGLGGGDSNTVSFTADPETAKVIHEVMLEARDFLAGETKVKDLVAEAERKGYNLREAFAVVAGKKGYDLFLEGYDPSSETHMGAIAVDDMPAGAKPLTTWEGGDGKTYTSGYHARLVKGTERQMEVAWDFFRSFLWARAQAGGKMNPLFFNTDIAALAKRPRSAIKLIEVTTRKGAMGIRMGGLKEYRAWTGKVAQDMRVL
jgi:hypothetical protein